MATDDGDTTHFVNADDQKLFCKYWEPDGEIRALAFLIHGLGEHILRYEKIAKMLTDLGFKACGHDHIGHGQSEGKPADVKDFHFYSRDSLQHVDLMKKKHPNLPLFIISHSMGCLINILMANERPTEFISLMVSPALALNPKEASPLKIFGAKVASWCYYNMSLPKISSSTLSRDPAVCKDYDDDPLVYHDALKVGFLMKMYNVQLEAHAAAPSVEWPFLLMHGDVDELCYIGGSKKFYEAAKSKDKTFKVYEGYYHEMDKEPDEYSTVIFADMKEWLSSHL